jgi:Domain of unknown function (DUF4352)
LPISERSWWEGECRTSTRSTGDGEKMAEELGTDASESETKPCPFCAEDIRAAAVKCRYCGSMLTDEEAGIESVAQISVESTGVNENTATPNVFTGIGGLILLVLLTMYVIENYGDELSPLLEPIGIATKSSESVVEPRVFSEGARVVVGGLAYRVLYSRWEIRFNGMVGERADAAFLAIALEVQNDGERATAIAAPHLIDDEGSEHVRTSKDFLVRDRLRVGEDLNPNVSRQVHVAFDVPRGDGYKLKVFGGGTTEDTALILLKPPR